MIINVNEYLEREKQKEIERQEAEAYDWWESLYNPNEDAGDRD